MPITHIEYGSGPKAPLIVNTLAHLESAVDGLGDLIATMALMLDGDGTNEAHFTAYVIAKFGYVNAAGAKASWDELNSLYAKLNTDAAVTNVKAAIAQCINKHR